MAPFPFAEPVWLAGQLATPRSSPPPTVPTFIRSHRIAMAVVLLLFGDELVGHAMFYTRCATEAGVVENYLREKLANGYMRKALARVGLSAPGD